MLGRQAVVNLQTWWVRQPGSSIFATKRPFQWLLVGTCLVGNVAGGLIHARQPLSLGAAVGTCMEWHENSCVRVKMGR